MANVKITTEGLDDVRRVFVSLNPGESPEWVRRALVKGGLRIQANAAGQQIIRGGKGPPHPHRLTSRSGTGRRSIRVDRGGLPRFFVDVGTDLRYMAAHETGGTFTRRAHSRRSKLGNLHQVRAHSMTYPPRPFLRPALEEVDSQLEGIFIDEWGRGLSR